MLKEFAFTPHVFDPNGDPNNPNWRECIRTIAIRLFTQPVTPLVVAGLHATSGGCSWEQVTRQTISAISDSNLRVVAQQFFKQLSNVMVYRPPCCDWPGEDETGWGKEAADSHSREPLHQIVAQQTASIPAPAPSAALAHALSPDFWTALQQEHSAPASLAEDVARFRSLVVHSECIVLSAPYESMDKFAVELIQQAVRRPPSYPKPVIHVHQWLPPKAKPDARMSWLQQQLRGIAGKSIVHWWFWPDPHIYRERVVLGGRLAHLGNGQTKFGVRYGVAMTHVWGEGDSANVAPTTYTMLSAARSKEHMDALERGIANYRLAPVLL